MTYLAFDFKVEPREPGTEILIAQLGLAGFESFVETDAGVTAYIQAGDWSEDLLEDIQILQSGAFEISYRKEEIAQTNWNSEWEKNFNPIEVDGIVAVRAPFHERKELPYDIVIEPKMSFGTGHHETTHMMLQHLIGMDIQGKAVLDMGCGTGILAIFADMKGAESTDAIDIDSWCYENSLENVKRNSCNGIRVYEGDAGLLPGRRYDLIIANINRNILLQDMEVYCDCLNAKGTLLLSGFYTEDIPALEAVVTAQGLILDKVITRNNWAALKFDRP